MTEKHPVRESSRSFTRLRALDARQDRILVAHNDLCIRRTGLSAVGRATIHGQLGVRIDRGRHALALLMKGDQLLVRHLVDLVHL